MNSEPGFFPATEVAARPSGPSPFRAAVLGSLTRMGRGRLHLELPDGTAAEFGSGEAALPLGVGGLARIRVRREGFFRKCVLSGDIGFAESYMDGDWSSPDLVAVIGWFVVNIDLAPTLSGSARARSLALNLMRFANRLCHALRPATRTMARRNISEHYDLSNEFFSLFLDPSMMYSAARWSRPGLTLEEAQREKTSASARRCASARMTACWKSGPDGADGPSTPRSRAAAGSRRSPFHASSTNTPRAAWRRPAFPAGWS